jgi:hypothetical protein
MKMREETSSKEILRSIMAGVVARVKAPDQSEVSHMIYTYGLFGQITKQMFVQCSTSDIANLISFFSSMST